MASPYIGLKLMEATARSVESIPEGWRPVYLTALAGFTLYSLVTIYRGTRNKPNESRQKESGLKSLTE